MNMSTITSYDDALDFLPKAGTAPNKRPNFLARVRLVLEAMREGHAAARRYRELTAHGVPHDEAARRVFSEVYSVR
jgi:hypothetical protein